MSDCLSWFPWYQLYHLHIIISKVVNLYMMAVRCAVKEAQTCIKYSQGSSQSHDPMSRYEDYHHPDSRDYYGGGGGGYSSSRQAGQHYRGGSHSYPGHTCVCCVV